MKLLYVQDALTENCGNNAQKALTCVANELSAVGVDVKKLVSKRDEVFKQVCDVKDQCKEKFDACKKEMDEKRSQMDALRKPICECMEEGRKKVKDAGCEVPDVPKMDCENLPAPPPKPANPPKPPHEQFCEAGKAPTWAQLKQAIQKMKEQFKPPPPPHFGGGPGERKR
jgi:hypothetical protein